MMDTIKILLVEDSLDDAELLKRFTSRIGKNMEWHRVETEKQMIEALELTLFDIVIADYKLPLFSGPDAIRVLRSTGLDTPLIIVSGTVGEETAIEALRAGANDYILKGNMARLSSAIERAIKDVKFQREKRDTELQLIQAQKMETVGRLAGGVAHDVNNVLAAIRLFADMAVDQLKSNDVDKALKSLDGILKAEISAASIVRQLLLFSRRRVGPVDIVDFTETLKRVEGLVSKLTAESVKLTIHHGSNPITVAADDSQLEQIVLNLAVNARDAMPSGGEFEIKLEEQQVAQVPTDARIPVQPGKYAVLTATDSGFGMSPETLGRIFEPFFTTKEPGKGTGLGLSVIFGILRQAHGSVSVKSEVGKGTSFQIFWPIAQKSKTFIKRSEPKIPEIAGHKPTSILLVEDDDELREILAATLRKQGHSVVEASNGESGLKVLAENLKTIGLVVTDISMPGMNGTEMVRRGREISPQLVTLFLSGYVDDSLENLQLDDQMTFFLEKPFSAQSLSKKVGDILQVVRTKKRKNS